jgi:hypothetical protein
MFRRSLTALLGGLCITASSAVAQGPVIPPSLAQRQPPLFFREDWSGKPVQRGCVNLHDAKCEAPLSQANVSNPNLELKIYGAGKQRIENGEVLGAILVQGNHLFTGMTEQPFAVAFRDKNRYVDLSGLGKIRWTIRASGLHVVHPIIRLADGTWLLGEHADGGNQLQVRPIEFTVSDPEERWIRLDIDRVVTLGPREQEPVDSVKAAKLEAEMARAGVWLHVNQVDLTKVDVVGFADLMPGSGHGYGGFISMGTIEVYGSAVPR